jgi:hypothetical protein
MRNYKISKTNIPFEKSSKVWSNKHDICDTCRIQIPDSRLIRHYDYPSFRRVAQCICTPDPGGATVTQGGTLWVVENEQGKQQMCCVFQKIFVSVIKFINCSIIMIRKSYKISINNIP